MVKKTRTPIKRLPPGTRINISPLVKSSYKPCPETQLSREMQNEKNASLLEAAKSGEWGWAERLIKRGAGAHSRDGSQNTALTYAATTGKLELVREMAKDIEITINDPAVKAAFVGASANRHQEVTTLLIEKGDFLEPEKKPVSKLPGISITEEKWGAAKGYIGIDGCELASPKLKV